MENELYLQNFLSKNNDRENKESFKKYLKDKKTHLLEVHNISIRGVSNSYLKKVYRNRR